MTGTSTYRILTVQQPWADLLIPPDDLRYRMLTGNVPEWARQLPKDVENRTWGTAWRGVLLIRAGLTIDETAMQRFGLNPADFVRGAVVGTVRLVDVVSSAQSVWAERYPDPGKWMRHWVVDHPQRLDRPVECRAGDQGLRVPDPGILGAVLLLLEHQKQQAKQ